MVYLKTRSGFVTYRMIDEISFELCLESVDDDVSTVVVPHGTVDGDDAGAWLVREGQIFYVQEVTPGDERDTLKLAPPHSVFDRDILYDETWPQTSSGAFLAAAAADNFGTGQDDGMYRIDALTVSWDGETPFLLPAEVEEAVQALEEKNAEKEEGEEQETLGPVLFNLCDYVRRLREREGLFLSWTFTPANALKAVLAPRTFVSYSIAFGDGHSILDAHTYGGEDTVAKVTVRMTEDPGEVLHYYLAETGDIVKPYAEESGGAIVIVQPDPPSPRVPGQWVTKLMSRNQIVQKVDSGAPMRIKPTVQTAGMSDSEALRLAWKLAAWSDSIVTTETIIETAEDLAMDAFGDAVFGAHKVEFWDDRAYRLGDTITMRLDGRRVVGSISRTDETSGNLRRHYATGDLSLGLTEQIWRYQK